MTTTLRITIDLDRDTENPMDYSDWKLISFNTRDRNYEDPEEYLRINKNGRPEPNSVGLRSKIKAGTAHALDCFQHGDYVWSLSGSGPQCQWDTSRCAGILIWQAKPSDLGGDAIARTNNAKAFLEDYTNWANGYCYCCCIDMIGFCNHCQQPVEEHLDSCGGFIGEDCIQGHIQDTLAELIENKYRDDTIELEFDGDSKWIGEDIEVDHDQTV